MNDMKIDFNARTQAISKVLAKKPFINGVVPLGDWLEKKKVPAIIIKQQFGFPMSTT